MLQILLSNNGEFLLLFLSDAIADQQSPQAYDLTAFLLLCLIPAKGLPWSNQLSAVIKMEQMFYHNLALWMFFIFLVERLLVMTCKHGKVATTWAQSPLCAPTMEIVLQNLLFQNWEPTWTLCVLLCASYTSLCDLA